VVRETGILTPVFGVIGNPFMHSLSPVIHNRGMAALGIPGVYLPFAVDDLPAFMGAADLLGIHGLSVTVPHKESVIRYLATRDPAVERFGACNTLVRTEGGWHGTNTDAEGFLAPLRPALAGRALAGVKSCVIGAGGAARAVVAALEYAGMSWWVSKLSTVLKNRAKYGPCSGRSTADPPQRTATSAASFLLHVFSSSFEYTGTPATSLATLAASRVMIPASVVSADCAMAWRTPRPTFPYPTMAIAVFEFMASPRPAGCRRAVGRAALHRLPGTESPFPGRRHDGPARG